MSEREGEGRWMDERSRLTLCLFFGTVSLHRMLRGRGLEAPPRLPDQEAELERVERHGKMKNERQHMINGEKEPPSQPARGLQVIHPRAGQTNRASEIDTHQAGNNQDDATAEPDRLRTPKQQDVSQSSTPSVRGQLKSGQE